MSITGHIDGGGRFELPASFVRNLDASEDDVLGPGLSALKAAIEQTPVTADELHAVDEAARRGWEMQRLSRPMTAEAAAARRLAGQAMANITGGAR